MRSSSYCISGAHIHLIRLLGFESSHIRSRRRILAPEDNNKHAKNYISYFEGQRWRKKASRIHSEELKHENFIFKQLINFILTKVKRLTYIKD